MIHGFQLQLIDNRAFRTAAERIAYIRETIDRVRLERKLRKASRKQKPRLDVVSPEEVTLHLAGQAPLTLRGPGSLRAAKHLMEAQRGG